MRWEVVVTGINVIGIIVGGSALPTLNFNQKILANGEGGENEEQDHRPRQKKPALEMKNPAFVMKKPVFVMKKPVFVMKNSAFVMKN